MSLSENTSAEELLDILTKFSLDSNYPASDLQVFWVVKDHFQSELSEIDYETYHERLTAIEAIEDLIPPAKPPKDPRKYNVHWSTPVTSTSIRPAGNPSTPDVVSTIFPLPYEDDDDFLDDAITCVAFHAS